MKKFLLSGLCLLLTGCQSLSTQPTYMADGKPLGNHFVPWAQRQQQLRALQNWTAAGTIAVRNQVKGGWTASFNWQQQCEHYVLDLFGPLGINHLQLAGMPGAITLKTNRQTLTAANPEALLQQQTGLKLPVSSLAYWLRGLPAPHAREKHAVDMNKHIVHLDQGGWNVYYLRYVSVNGVDMPARMLLTNPPWVAHVVIKHWQLA